MDFLKPFPPALSPIQIKASHGCYLSFEGKPSFMPMPTSLMEKKVAVVDPAKGPSGKEKGECCLLCWCSAPVCSSATPPCHPRSHFGAYRGMGGQASQAPLISPRGKTPCPCFLLLLQGCVWDICPTSSIVELQWESSCRGPDRD